MEPNKIILEYNIDITIITIPIAIIVFIIIIPNIDCIINIIISFIGSPHLLTEFWVDNTSTMGQISPWKTIEDKISPFPTNSHLHILSWLNSIFVSIEKTLTMQPLDISIVLYTIHVWI